MFTPSFVLIPAREIIPGREIGLIAAWFTVSQVLAFVFPVLFNWFIDWTTGVPRKLSRRMKRTMSSTPSQFDTSRRASMATISGVDWEKGISFSGGVKLGPVATGLSGLTANIIAPISHLPMDVDADAWRQIESTAIEQARQQGDPAVTGLVDEAHPTFRYRDYSPKSDVSDFQHHHHHRPGQAGRSSSRQGRSKSRNRSTSRNRAEPHHRGSSKGLLAADDKDDSLTTPVPMSSYRFPSPNHDMDELEESLALAMPAPTHQPESRGRIATSRRPLDENKQDGHGIDVIEEGDEDPLATRVNSRNPSVPNIDVEARRPSKISFDVRAKDEAAALTRFSTSMSGIMERQQDSKASVVIQDKDDDGMGDEESAMPSVSGACGNSGCDAIERLSSWISDLITPTIYGILFLVGIPLFFVLDFALPLFLGINILTFIAAITIVPAKIRRFLHPILSCSIATVLIIWAFAAMKGIGLKDCLNRFYSVDMRYTDIWSPNGYNGPVPGAGDFLFSTLDAGIVALAVPMYRYRKELKENFVRMMVVLTPCAALSLFFWNWIAALMGMDKIRSLAFTARFMSTPLAIELATNIGADESITVILVVITGIIAAILKDHFFKLMRVDREDYLVVGITMGSTAGAIGASSLISTPRVMAVASLSFVIFGSLLLVATAIPPIVDIVRMLA